MLNYSFWVYSPDDRLYAVCCENGEVVAGVPVSHHDYQYHLAVDFAPEMTLGCGDWIREEVNSFLPVSLDEEDE